MKKLVTVLLLIATLIIPQLGCNAQVNYAGITKTSFHLNTVCAITVYSMDGLEDLSKEEQTKEVNLVITEAFKLCDKYERVLSKTIEGSDIYKINTAGGSAVEVYPFTLDVLLKGIEYGKASNGAFDITIGKATDLWNFKEVDENGDKIGTVPDADLLAEAVTHVDFNNIVIEGHNSTVVNGNTVRLADPQAEIDLGGIAKGFIADKVTEFLEEEGVTSAVVNLGGNIVTIGEKGTSLTEPQGQLFAIDIKDPTSTSGKMLGRLSCKDKTVVTSGTYERYFEVDGKKYHHILDTKTGYPTDTDVLAVTIIGEKGMSVDCDGISTSCLAMGTDAAMELVKSIDGLQAILVDTDGNVHMSHDDIDFVLN